MTDETPSFETVADAIGFITSNDPRFAVGPAEIRGIEYRVFQNAPGNLREMMQRATALHGEGDFVVYQDERMTYPAFCDRMNRLANALIGQGVAPGDRVALAMRNYPELVLLMMAVASIGAVVVPLNAWWTTEELDYAFGDSGAKLVFADAPRVDRISPFASERGVRIVGVRDGETIAPESLSQIEASAEDASWPTVPTTASPLACGQRTSTRH